MKKEIREKSLKYITAGFGLVAGLAWNDAIKSMIHHLFPLSRNTVFAKFIYAILMTLVLVIITIYLSKLLKKN